MVQPAVQLVHRVLTVPTAHFVCSANSVGRELLVGVGKHLWLIMLDLRPTSAGYILSGLSARFKGRVRSKEPPEQFPFEAVSPWLLFRAVHVQQLGLSSLVELTEDLVERVHVGFQVLVGSPLLVGDQWTLCPHHLTGSCSAQCVHCTVR